MAFVVDASTTLSWCFRDEQSAHAVAVLGRLANDGAIVPGSWALEVANGLLVGERRGRLTPADIAEVYGVLSDLAITQDEVTLQTALGSVLELARTHGLTAYDAAYLELAMREGLPLATLDGRLRAAATSVGTLLVE